MSFWRRKRSDRDFREEIESHLAFEAERQVKEKGVSPDDAGLAARRRFGNVMHAQERYHEAHRWAWADRLRQHVRYAVRSLRQHRGFSVAAVLTLAVGTGFCTAIFTIFNAVALRSLPVRDADEIVNVYQQFRGRVNRPVNGMASMVSYPEYLNYQATIDSLRNRGGALASAAAYAQDDFAFDKSGTGMARGEYVSCGYFQTLGTRIALGRAFAPDECRLSGGAAVAVISHAVWQRDFGSDSSVLGRVVRVNQIPVTVVGVAEPRFGGLTMLSSDLWVPVTLQMALSHGDSMAVHDWSWMYMAARLAPGGSAESARAQLTVAARQRDAIEPGRTADVIVARGAYLNFPEVRTQGALAAGFVTVLGALVIAMVCANIMNLLLARGLARRREIGIRLAIGASRARLVEQLVTESVLLALLGGALGLAFAYALPAIAARFLPITGLQIDFSPDQRVLWFTIAMSVITALAFGLVPALQATGVDLVSAFKGGMSSGGRLVRASRIRSFVVAVQVAGSALLLIVGALFVRGATLAASVSPGYATDNVIAFGFNTRDLGYPVARTTSTLETLRDRVAATPGVEGVTFLSPLPLLGRRSGTVSTDSVPGSRGHMDDVNMAEISGNFFETMRVSLLAGRAFTDAELRAAAPGHQPVVVSESFAKAFWPTESALGKRLRMSDQEPSAMHVIVGVAANTRYTTLAAGSPPFVYIGTIPGTAGTARIVARVANPAQMTELDRAVRRWARELDASLAVRTERLAERVALELKPPRLASGVSATMGALAMLLAVVGIYGIVSYAVSQRTRDIAVRLALGASRGGVVRLMMREGSLPVLLGLVVGVGAALGVSQVIRGLLFGISGLDPLVYLGTFVLIATASLAAMYAPARRAARVDPALTLREE